MCWLHIPSARVSPVLVKVLLLAAALAVARCGDTVSPAPSNPYAGVWAGTLVDDTAGPGTFTMALAGDAVLTGSWSASVAGRGPGGTLTSDPAGTPTRSFAASCASPGQGSLLITTTVSGASMSGTYRSFLCDGLVTGSLDLARR
jgi:hypothetical protein